MNFSGMLNSKGGWKGYSQHNKWAKVERLQIGFFRAGKFLCHGKYGRYSRNQPDLMWSYNRCYHGQRMWNYGRTRQNKHFSLFYCRN